MNLLDHGYLTIIPKGCWGDDELIIESARMSTDKGFQGWGPTTCSTCAGHGIIPIHTSRSISPMSRDPKDVQSCPKCEGTGRVAGDEKLLAYLWKHKHLTPFEMAGATVEVQAPIFVFREWQRHRTQSYNELSARYTELPDLYYVPDHGRLARGGQAITNKQSSGVSLDDTTVSQADLVFRRAHAYSRESYGRLLDLGVARELARGVLPFNQFSRMRASANLRNWLAFLTLRQAPGAQWEIRVFADALHAELSKRFPRTLSLFDES